MISKELLSEVIMCLFQTTGARHLDTKTPWLTGIRPEPHLCSNWFLMPKRTPPSSIETPRPQAKTRRSLFLSGSPRHPGCTCTLCLQQTLLSPPAGSCLISVLHTARDPLKRLAPPYPLWVPRPAGQHHQDACNMLSLLSKYYVN